MSFTTNDYNNLQKLMNQSPENKALLQKLLDEQQYTISKISHEIRNPLTLVYSTLQLIEGQHPEVTSFKHWNGMHEDIEFMIQLLQELSAFNNGERLTLTTFNIHDLIGRICLSFAASCLETDVEFTSSIASLPEFTGDCMKLQEVILNLLRNALDAVKSKVCVSDTKHAGRIRLDAFSEKEQLFIKITDNGCGIPANQLDEIFDTFVTHKQGGTGLGLAIAKRTIETHKGTISVTSEQQKETCFTIILPLN